MTRPFAFAAILLVGAALGVAAPAAVAQPLALSRAEARPLGSVATLRLPDVSNAALLQRDATMAARGTEPGAERFAEPFPYALDARSTGTWEQMGADRVWRLVVESPGAYSLNLGFSQFRLPDGAALWIYAPGAAPEYRPFTSADNEAHGQLWTPLVPGDRVVIELDLAGVKAGGADEFALVLGQVGHAYRPALLTGTEKAAAARGAAGRSAGDAALSGSCNVDVVCSQGDGYRDIIRSSGAYTRGGTSTCSGAAVNSTRGDGEPNFLTANHCGNSAGNAPSVVVYWNYQNSTCRPVGSPASGGAGDGPRTQFNTGTVFRGTAAASDWNLLTFDDPILPAARVFLSGWDRRDAAPASAVGIHHPAVEEKRISFENEATSITTYSSDTAVATGTHIRISDWNLGTTEGGSSGSPLYSSERRIVGQLHGGAALCGNDLPDWYGRLFHSMNTGLAALLDPAGTGAQTVDGREATSALFAAVTAAPAALGRGQTARITVAVSNTTPAMAGATRYESTMPAGLTLTGTPTASAGTVAVSGRALTWTADVSAGGSASVAFDVLVGASASQGALAIEGTLQHPTLTAPAAVRVTLNIQVPADVVAENAAAVVIPDDACPAVVTSTITVPTGFDPVAVKVGVNATHPYRGDLVLRLASARGTVVTLVDRVGGSADHFDALFSDSGPAGVFGSGNHDPAAPFYNVEGQATNALTPLATEDAAGTWTLRVCDDAALDLGQVNRWALFFYNAGNPTSGEPSVVAKAEVTVESVRPNPTAGSARLRFAVRAPQHVRADVIDAAGRTVAVLLDRPVAAGAFETLDVDAARLPSGTYFVRIAGETFTETRTVSVAR